MIKPKSKYLVLTPAGNAAIISGSVQESTKYTRQVVQGKELQGLLDKLPAISVERMELYELKEQLVMKPVTTVVVSTSAKGGK